jgi:hypothetical protein
VLGAARGEGGGHGGVGQAADEGDDQARGGPAPGDHACEVDPVMEIEVCVKRLAVLVYEVGEGEASGTWVPPT